MARADPVSELSLSTLSFIKSCKLDSEKIEETGRDSHQIALKFLLIGIKQRAHVTEPSLKTKRSVLKFLSNRSPIFSQDAGRVQMNVAATRGSDACGTVSYTHLTLPTKRIV